MSCKKTEDTLKNSDLSELSEVQLKQIEDHVRSCDSCHELYSQDLILSSLFSHAGTDEEYMIPEDVMKAKVKKRLTQPVRKFNLPKFIREPYVISAATLMLFVVVSISYFSINDSQNGVTNHFTAYEVNLNGISPEFAEDHTIICDMLSSAGLDDASVDILGCDKNCNIVIFDLKNKEEAELVVDIFQAIDTDEISTEVNQVKDYDQQVL